jgi:hypothetical protein
MELEHRPVPNPTITIDAGPHDRLDCPIEFKAPDSVAPGTWALLADGAPRLQLEVGAGGTARCVLHSLGAGQKVAYRLEPAGPGASAPAVSLADTEGALELALRGEQVTRYCYRDAPGRPYLYPVLAPGQTPVTRAYPMAPDAPGETRDHPHHRSLWIAHGDVNGADNWSEEPGHGRTLHDRFGEIRSGAVSGSFSSRSTWMGPDAAPLLTQRLQVTLWNTGGDARILDFAIDLEASHGDVHFGDTKEGGILSVRVASELDVPRTGRITNVYGGIDEAETWGKAAHWCDYSGTVAGVPAGIAVLDHPHSFRYPTHWHVRNYGLMTANPFGYAAYTNGVKDGSHALAAGGSLSFRYRVVLHRGGCEEARIRERYLDFAAPPRVSLTL